MASRIMETIPGGDGELIELEAVRKPYREVRFDVTHENEELEHYPVPEHAHALQRNSWSCSTKRVLSSMPSRSIRWNQTTAVSQYQSRSTRMRRRRPVSICPTDQEVFTEQGCPDDVTQNEEFLKKLQGLSAGECVRLLREMPLSVSEKRQIRAYFYSLEAELPLSANKGLCCHQFQACCLKVLCGGWIRSYFQQTSIQLWQKVFKNISARFGTGVLSYFIFLRSLLHYNFLLFLINGLFLIFPQLLNPPQTSDAIPKFDLFVMLTGMGVFTNSVMFYGYYANSTIGNCQMCPENYNIPLAYIFTIGIGMFVTCVLLVYSMSKLFGKNFRTVKKTGNLALKVFCSWDFKVIKKRSVKLQSVNICIQMKEMLSELSCRKPKTNLCTTLSWLTIHLLVWSICLLCMGFCTVAVLHLHPYIEWYKENTEQVQSVQEVDHVRLLISPLVVSCISHLLPSFFDMLSMAERYASPIIHVYVSIVRNLLLKSCIFGMLCYFWLKKIKVERQEIKCWETFVGQELYRLVLMDLIFSVLYIILTEFLWGLCIRNCTLRRRKLELNIAQEVLELIYGQTLVWFGVLFSPLLPAMQIGKLLLLFYLKKTSLMVNFQPPRKHWRATQMNTLFISLLFFPSFTGALTCVIYAMWRINPSSECGPFRNLKSMLITVKQWFIGLGETNHRMFWLSWAYINLVDNPTFLFIVAGLFVTIIYINIQLLDGQKMIIVRLQEQIDNEGEDKKFLIARIQALNELNAGQ